MRLSKSGYPVIIVSHRRQEFLETCVDSLRQHATGITDVIVVDDSGDERHHEWLDNQGYQLSLSSPDGSNVGYLGAMQTTWETGRETGAEYVLLWEEDFILTKPLYLGDMVTVMENSPTLAQLNLQRQAVYSIERRLGYMQSHHRRGYDLAVRMTEDVPWISRRRPFTTNPGMIRSKVLDIDWPYRAEADLVPGGAEPAMSIRLESHGYTFGWLGRSNTPHTKHVGTLMKSGKGY